MWIAEQCSAAQRSAVQCRAEQCSAVQCSGVQYRQASPPQDRYLPSASKHREAYHKTHYREGSSSLSCTSTHSPLASAAREFWKRKECNEVEWCRVEWSEVERRGGEGSGVE